MKDRKGNSQWNLFSSPRKKALSPLLNYNFHALKNMFPKGKTPSKTGISRNIAPK
jgi:hypothetical protein